jgi:pimeloyl-ACP methyl ester carboxylesterase
MVADDPARPPLLLVHGAANAAAVWRRWQTALADLGWSSWALDLRGHGESEPVDLSATRMADYVDDVRAAARRLARPPALLGWSMGGLVVLMAASVVGAVACVALAPSAPAATTDPAVPLRTGTFGPEEYGIRHRDPGDQPSMPDLDRDARALALASLGPESRLARDERKAGIVLDPLACPLLVVTGGRDALWPRRRYAGCPVAAEWLEAPGASHWGLVLGRDTLPELVPAVARWLDAARQR